MKNLQEIETSPIVYDAALSITMTRMIENLHYYLSFNVFTAQQTVMCLYVCVRTINMDSSFV